MEQLDRESLHRIAAGEFGVAGAPRLPMLPLLGFDEVWDLKVAGGVSGLGGAKARVDTRRLRWIFDCHFVDDPVMPGTFMLDSLIQLVGLYGGMHGLIGRGRAGRVQDVRFLKAVTPDFESIEYSIVVQRLSRSRQAIMADGEVRAKGQLCMTVKDMLVVVTR